MEVIYTKRTKGQLVELHIKAGNTTLKYEKQLLSNELSLVNIQRTMPTDKLLEARRLLDTIDKNIN